MTLRLIITADDYGLCPAVNEAIEECLEAGALQSTCVMTNMPDHGSACSLREKFPRSSVGIHWTLTQGRPVLSPSVVPSLVSDQGEFLSSSEIRSAWAGGRIRRDEVRAELIAQCELFRRVAGMPDFWNTHQNVHVYPGLFQIFVEVGREMGILAMRCHRRVTVPKGTNAFTYSVLHPFYLIKGLIISRWANTAIHSGVQMPFGRLYMPGYGTAPIEFIEEVAKQLNGEVDGRVLEAVVHPASSIVPGLFGKLTESRLIEHRILTDPELKTRLKLAGTELVSFKELSFGKSNLSLKSPS